MSKSISFVFSNFYNHPIGGYKIIFEYANRLTEKGYKVYLTYPVREIEPEDTFKVLRKIKRFITFKLLHCYRVTWFKLNPNVKEVFIKGFSKGPDESFFKKMDYVVATALKTSYYVNKIKSVTDESKYYFIQDYEKWDGVSDGYVMNSFKLPLKKIVIASWLKDIVNQCNEEALLIPNGFDFDFFNQTVPYEKRDPFSVSFLYHEDERKRVTDTIKALEIVKSKIPELKVYSFGVPERPSSFPDWIIYFQKPSREEHNFVYNNSAIFIASSSLEGFGLTPVEALICGCAICVTDTTGFKTYAFHDRTALLSPVYDINQMAENIISLINNPEKRIKLAKAGKEFVSSFTWESAIEKFISYLN